MITGTVNASNEAIVQLRIRGAVPDPLSIHALIDTGFTDWLTLSPAQIVALGLAFREEGAYVLADGSMARARLFSGEVEWLTGWRRILVLEMDGGPLIGMALLRGSYLGAEIIDGGKVEVRSLTP